MISFLALPSIDSTVKVCWKLSPAPKCWTLSFSILYDRFYPELQPKGDDNYQQPLQLLAKRLQFIDPINQQVNDWQTKDLIS
ncbi:hypothetical protein [Shewanella holmiensis]|uniref:Uncharacterized protein n=1 Tax=Shewanella holmiensis TaxID=2952222 RepID=A0A9X2WRG9_9GAMM|nr:hypothetical protein [Shewanella holmiensis]